MLFRGIFLFFLQFCVGWVCCYNSDLVLTVANYLDIDHDSNVTFTLFNELTRENMSLLPIKYSERYSLAVNGQKVSVWNISFTINDNLEKHYVSDNVIVVSDPLSNISATVYGSVNESKSNVILRQKHINSQPSLGIDKASLNFINQLPYPVNYSVRSDNCYKCLDRLLGFIDPGESVYVCASTQFVMSYSFQTNEHVPNICRAISHHFEQHKHYAFNITVHLNKSNCLIVERSEEDEPQNVYMPIVYVGIVLLGSFLIWTIGTQGYIILKKKGMLHFRGIDRRISKDMGDPSIVQKEYGTVNQSEKNQLLSSSTESSATTQANVTPAIKKRLKSLDTVRGFSLMIMIFVNYGGGGYWFFDHSRWNGVTVADLVFPWFVWIMGVSIVFSFSGRRKNSFLSSLYQIVRRSVILMGLGLFLNNGFTLSNWRIPGVLQRFAVSYFVVALTEFLTVPIYSLQQSKLPKSKYFADLTNNWVQWLIIIVLEIIWLSVTFGLNVPGCPKGYLGPGGLSEGGKYKNCTGGAAGYIDRWLLTEKHIYQHPTCKELYQTGPYEPEGILGTINSIIICFLGVQAGKIITYHKHHGSRLLRFIIWGVLLGGIAAALCEGQKDGGLIPLNKNLWSLSFVLAMAGLGFILLSLFYFLIDVIGIWNGTPFIYPGMNSILVYVGSELLEGMFPFGWSGMKDSHFELLTSNLVSVLLWALIAYYWYAIEFFVKI